MQNEHQKTTVASSAKPPSAPPDKVHLLLYAIIAISFIDILLSLSDSNFIPSIIVLGDKDYTNYALIVACYSLIKWMGSKKASSEVDELLPSVLAEGEFAVHQQRGTIKLSLLKGELGVLVATNRRLLFFKIADVNGDNTDFLPGPQLTQDWDRSKLNRIEGGAISLTFLDASNTEIKIQMGLGQNSKWADILNGVASENVPDSGRSDSGDSSSQNAASAVPNAMVSKAKSVAEGALKAGQVWAERGMQPVGGMEGVKAKAASLRDDLTSGRFREDVISKKPEALRILAGIVGVVLFVMYLLFSSGDKYVSTVRNGIMKEYSKGKTVGDAFEKSDVVSGGKWTSAKVSTGERIVQFSGSIKGIEKTISTTMKEGENEAKAKGLGAIFDLANPFMKMFDIVRVDSCVYTVQFEIDAHDKNSFELKAAELTVKASPTGDAKQGIKKLLSEELSVVDGEVAVLKAIFEADQIGAAIAVKGLVLKQVMTAGALMD